MCRTSTGVAPLAAFCERSRAARNRVQITATSGVAGVLEGVVEVQVVTAGVALEMAKWVEDTAELAGAVAIASAPSGLHAPVQANSAVMKMMPTHFSRRAGPPSSQLPCAHDIGRCAVGARLRRPPSRAPTAAQIGRSLSRRWLVEVYC